MPEIILGIDQGSSSTRCQAFDAKMRILSSASRPVASQSPKAGWVEHDPEQIFLSTLQTLEEARQSAGASWDQVVGIGIATQTETFVVWEKSSGQSVYPAISWRDQRSADACENMKSDGLQPIVRRKTGLELEPTFSASKLRWLLDNVEGAEERAKAGQLLFGDVACWLLWRLSGGTAHFTEPSNAHRSLLVALDTLQWDEELVELFGIPSQMLPEIRDSDDIATFTDPLICGGAVPISAMLGDQQAALLGQGCMEKGTANLTLGTGAFVWANAGQLPPEPPPGVLASCAWKTTVLGTAYALEGFATNAGSIVTWLRNSGFLHKNEDLQNIFDPNVEPVFVPALEGLGTPHWNPATSASLFGITSQTKIKDISAAALMGVVHQIVDAIEAVKETQSLDLLRVAGGMSANEPLVQALADLCHLAIEKTSFPESTSRGVGWIAARSSEIMGDVNLPNHPVHRLEPQMDDKVVSEARRRWKHALEEHLAYVRDHEPI